MWNLFKKTESEGGQNTDGTSIKSTELMTRAVTYFGKLEARCEEILAEVKASAQLLADADTDPYKRSYLQFKGAILAQYTTIIQKGSETFHNQIMPQANGMEMMRVSQLFNDWHSKVLYLMTHAFDDVTERNLEKEYAEVMQEYEAARDAFHCKQCGAKLPIERFYFTATYLTCAFCQTQNTFDPGSKARMMEHIARPLADSRCKTEYEAYRHRKAEVGQQEATADYERYVRAMIAQMNAILPGMEEQHENFYNRLMKDYSNLIVPW